MFVPFVCRSSRIFCSVKQLDTDWFFLIQFQKCNLFGHHAQIWCCVRTNSLPLFTNALYPVNRKLQHALHLVSISRMTGWWLIIFYITIERWSQGVFIVILHYSKISKICKPQILFGVTTLCLSETSYWVCLCVCVCFIVCVAQRRARPNCAFYKKWKKPCVNMLFNYCLSTPLFCRCFISWFVR